MIFKHDSNNSAEKLRASKTYIFHKHVLMSRKKCGPKSPTFGLYLALVIYHHTVSESMGSDTDIKFRFISARTPLLKIYIFTLSIFV